MASDQLRKKWGTVFMGEREATVDQLDAMQEPLRRERAQQQEQEDYFARVRAKAEERARILVSDAEIVKAAQQRASEITSAAQTEARTLRQTVTDYCDNMLKNTEETMVENAAQVKNVRANLRQNAKKNG